MMDSLFTLSSLLVMPFWLLMIVLPRTRLTRQVISSPFIIVPAAALYALLVLPAVGAILPAVANPTLDGIATLLGTPAGALIAWVHFLAFDLAVGRWAYLDSLERGVSAWLMAPTLLLILLLGPLGFLLYLGVRASWCSAWKAKSGREVDPKRAGYEPADEKIVRY